MTDIDNIKRLCERSNGGFSIDELNEIADHLYAAPVLDRLHRIARDGTSNEAFLAAVLRAFLLEMSDLDEWMLEQPERGLRRGSKLRRRLA